MTYLRRKYDWRWSVLLVSTRLIAHVIFENSQNRLSPVLITMEIRHLTFGAWKEIRSGLDPVPKNCFTLKENFFFRSKHLKLGKKK